MARVTNAAVAVRVARLLEEEITSSGGKPGDFIGRRQELAARFSVAPATLGEAIQLLRSRGVVDAKPGPGGGIFVADRSPFMRLSDQLLSLREGQATVADCLRVLDALDAPVLHDAVDFATEADVEDVRLLAERLEASWGTPRSAAANWALHARIAQITPNELLRSLYTNLVDYIIEEELVGATAPTTAERLRTHLDLAAAIVSHDHGLATSALERHRGSSMAAVLP